MKKILVLGAGLVTKPLVNYLLDNKIFVTLADIDLSKAKNILSEHPLSEAVLFDAKNEEALESLIGKHDLVVSLLPYTLHVTIAKSCLKKNKSLVTASYVSEEMKKLDTEAKSKGLIFLNEIGLDPGIDHISAMKIIDKVYSAGGKVKSFISNCGGLPSPKDTDNPFGYKFSWSPKGVLLAGRNSAQYLMNGKVENIKPENLFHTFWENQIDPLGEFEIYPNRNSLIYKELYGLRDAETVFRGTIRNIGWCNNFSLIVEMGFLNDEENTELKNLTYKELTAKLLSCNTYEIEKILQNKFPNLTNKNLETLKWLGLFDEKKISSDRFSLIDILANLMLSKMPYRKGEQDMVVLNHQFITEDEKGNKKKIVSNLIAYGEENGNSAMSLTVGLPAAIAAKLIVDNKIEKKGVIIPLKKEIYNPVLAELENLGIKFIEKEREA